MSSLPLLLKRGWVRSPIWDGFWMFSALWLSLIVIGIGSFTSLISAALIVFVANRIAGLAHSYSTTYLVLWSPILTEVRKQDRVKYFYVPVAIISISFLLGYLISQYQWYGETGEFSSDLWIWSIYISLFWVGHFWHFGNQDFGVLSFYRAKAGQQGANDRNWDRRYATSMMFVIQPMIFLMIYNWKEQPFSEVVHYFIPFSKEVTQFLAGPSLVVALLFTAFMIFREIKNEHTSIQKILYYLIMATHPTFLFYGSTWVAPLYTIAYLWSHWMIAIGLSSLIGQNYYVQKTNRNPQRALLTHFLFVGGITLCVWLLTNQYHKYSLFGRDGLTIRVTLGEITNTSHWIAGFFLGYFLAEQLLHYYCDRILFRFRDPKIRENIVPLLNN